MTQRTLMQLEAKQVWESLRIANEHLDELRYGHETNDEFYQVRMRIEQAFDAIRPFMHEDDCI